MVSDPFADASKDDKGGAHGENFIHIRIQQRSGRKTLTTVQGISNQYDLKKIVKACKKVCAEILELISNCYCLICCVGFEFYQLSYSSQEAS